MQNTNSRPYASCDIAFSFLLISFFPRRYNAKHKLKAICIVWHCVFFWFLFFPEGTMQNTNSRPYASIPAKSTRTLPAISLALRSSTPFWKSYFLIFELFGLSRIPLFCCYVCMFECMRSARTSPFISLALRSTTCFSKSNLHFFCSVLSLSLISLYGIQRQTKKLGKRKVKLILKTRCWTKCKGNSGCFL